jgi:hypothetical protein
MQNSVAINSSETVRKAGFAVSTRPARRRLWKKIRDAIDRSGESWRFVQSRLFRPNPSAAMRDGFCCEERRCSRRFRKAVGNRVIVRLGAASKESLDCFVASAPRNDGEGVEARTLNVIASSCEAIQSHKESLDRFRLRSSSFGGRGRRKGSLAMTEEAAPNQLQIIPLATPRSHPPVRRRRARVGPWRGRGRLPRRRPRRWRRSCRSGCRARGPCR